VTVTVPSSAQDSCMPPAVGASLTHAVTLIKMLCFERFFFMVDGSPGLPTLMQKELQTKKYGLPEITACAVTAAAAALLFFSVPGWLHLSGWFRVAAIIPATMLALVLFRGNVRKAWETWKAITRIIVMPVGLALLTFSFVFGVGMTKLIARIFGVHLLDMKFEKRDTYWVEREQKEVTLEKAQRPF